MIDDPYYDDEREWRLEMAEQRNRAFMRDLDRRDGVPAHLTDDAQENKEE